MPFKFEKLEIWTLAIQFADEVHSITRSFSKEESFLSALNLKEQDSISLNIAAGSIGQSDAEQNRFLKRNYTSEEIFGIQYRKSEELFAKMNKFRRTLSNNHYN